MSHIPLYSLFLVFLTSSVCIESSLINQLAVKDVDISRIVDALERGKKSSLFTCLSENLMPGKNNILGFALQVLDPLNLHSFVVESFSNQSLTCDNAEGIVGRLRTMTDNLKGQEWLCQGCKMVMGYIIGIALNEQSAEAVGSIAGNMCSLSAIMQECALFTNTFKVEYSNVESAMERREVVEKLMLNFNLYKQKNKKILVGALVEEKNNVASTMCCSVLGPICSE